MGPQLRSTLLAGFIASTIWMFITTATDSSKSTVLVGGVVFLVGTALITAAISYALARNSTGATGR